MAYIGIHQSFNGFPNAVLDADLLHANTFQIFIRNNRNLKQRQFQQTEFDVFNQYLLRTEHFGPYVIHASYSMNPASGDEDLRSKAKKLITEDMQILSHLCGTKYYVLHPGASTDYDRHECVDNLIKVLHDLKDNYKGTRLSVETMAGQGTQLVSNITELNYVMSECSDLPDVYFCVDLCHLFGAGMLAYDVARLFEEKPDRLGVLHVNNSLKPFNSRLDRHANINSGVIPRELLLDQVRLFHELNSEMPIILETPESGLVDDLQILQDKFC